jgi:spore germination cell wall hydrolase CwlJ-like protein
MAAHCLGLAGGVALALLAPESALADDDPAYCLAMAIYWEARTCGRDEMAVDHVVLNRLEDPEFPDDVCVVVKEGGEQPPCQFSWRCDGEPDEPEDAEEWRLARKVAAELLDAPRADPTGAALCFHSTDLETPWAIERERTAASHCQVFYR